MAKSFPFYLQHDFMDWGPTSLRMVAKYYGKNYSLQYLRKRTYITREGVSLLGISEAAEAIGFRTVGARLPFEKFIEEAPLPCIVHWNQNHFAVAYKATKKTISVADPAVGLLHYSHEDFKKNWISSIENNQEVGIALLLEPSPEFYDAEAEVEQNKSSLGYILGYLKGYKKYIVQLIIGLLAGSLMQLILPFLTQAVIDVGIRTHIISFT